MISSREAGLKLGLSHRTIRLYCQQGKLKCQKIRNRWVVEEESLDSFITVEVVGNQQSARQTGKEKETFVKGLELPPFHIMSQKIGYLEGKLEVYENRIKELKATINLLQEQLDYRKQSWIRKLFKR
ncbi:hypothetical protein ES703_34285 [subsurface metagenome]